METWKGRASVDTYPLYPAQASIPEPLQPHAMDRIHGYTTPAEGSRAWLRASIEEGLPSVLVSQYVLAGWDSLRFETAHQP